MVYEPSSITITPKQLGVIYLVLVEGNRYLVLVEGNRYSTLNEDQTCYKTPFFHIVMSPLGLCIFVSNEQESTF